MLFLKVAVITLIKLYSPVINRYSLIDIVTIRPINNETNRDIKKTITIN